MRRRGATDLSGVLPVDKPPGMTSHDVVNAVRRASGERRVGHAGTLDPSARGLLVVLVGPMTRLARFFTEHPKAYRASVAFGRETTTDDAEGEVTREAPVPTRLADEETARRAVAGLVGPRLQVPPAFSAVKVGGRKAYHVARKGGEPELTERQIEVYEAELVAIDPGPPLIWRFEVTVSSGTYIRSLARDLGRDAGSAAHLADLVRTSSGNLALADARSLDEVDRAGEEGGHAFRHLFVDPVSALGLPRLQLDEKTAAAVSNGVGLPALLTRDVPDGGLVALTRDGALLAIHERHGAELRPEVVLPGGPVR